MRPPAASGRPGASVHSNTAQDQHAAAEQSAGEQALLATRVLAGGASAADRSPGAARRGRPGAAHRGPAPETRGADGATRQTLAHVAQRTPQAVTLAQDRSSTGCATAQMSMSGSSMRPTPSMLSRVFCSRISCGCRVSSNFWRSEQLHHQFGDRDLRQRPGEVRLAHRAHRGFEFVQPQVGGIQPASMCSCAMRGSRARTAR